MSWLDLTIYIHCEYYKVQGEFATPLSHSSANYITVEARYRSQQKCNITQNMCLNLGNSEIGCSSYLHRAYVIRRFFRAASLCHYLQYYTLEIYKYAVLELTIIL